MSVAADRLTFEEEGHVYRVDGQRVPSVTQVLDPYTRLEFVHPEDLERARILGTRVHQACHLWNLEELDVDVLDPILVPYLDAWRAFLDDTGAVVILSEVRVVSDLHGYAGTLDDVLAWKRSERLVDVKSGVIPKTVGPQTAAYRQALAESKGLHLRDRYCVQLRPDGTYRCVKLSDPRDWTIFKSALNVHQWHRGG